MSTQYQWFLKQNNRPMKISKESYELIIQKTDFFRNEMLLNWNLDFDKEKQINILQDIIQEIEENDHLCFIN